jgi:hypothetical protein
METKQVILKIYQGSRKGFFKNNILLLLRNNEALM